MRGGVWKAGASWSSRFETAGVTARLGEGRGLTPGVVGNPLRSPPAPSDEDGQERGKGTGSRLREGEREGALWGEGPRMEGRALHGSTAPLRDERCSTLLLSSLKYS